MAKSELTPPQATWLATPGESIQAGIDAACWTKRQFAERMGYSEKHVSLLLSAKVPITPDAAQRLSRVLGGAVDYWLTREAQYQGELAQRKEQKTLGGWVEWLEDLPRTYLRKLGFLQAQRKGKDQVRECLAFYGVASPDAWRDWNSTLQASFHSAVTRNMEKNMAATSTWLRVGELQAAKITCQPYDKKAFQKTIPKLRKLMLQKDSKVLLPKMRVLCAAAGVALVTAPAPRACGAYGATRWLSPQKTLLLLHNPGEIDERWWFRFFYLCGHLLLHSKKATFVDLPKAAISKEAEQANSFAVMVLAHEGRHLPA